MICVLWQGRSTCIVTHTQPAAAVSLPAQIHQCFSWLWDVVNVVHILFKFLELVHHIAFCEPNTAKLLLQSVRCWVFCTCFRNVFFGLLSLYVDDSMCNKRFLVHALLVTTLKKHMSAAARMCCGYSVFWGFCGLGFSELLKVLLHGLGEFVVVVYFAYEGIFNYWNLLSIETFRGIKLYCNDQNFPCCMQEDGLGSFLRSLQHFISAALYF